MDFHGWKDLLRMIPALMVKFGVMLRVVVTLMYIMIMVVIVLCKKNIYYWVIDKYQMSLSLIAQRMDLIGLMET